MPNKPNLYGAVRRFLTLARRILGLVLLVLEILRRVSDFLK